MERISQYKNVVLKVSEALLSNPFTSFVKVLVVSKKRPIEQIMEIYEQGHRDFGENYAAELIEKSEKLPKDINWHMIGHLQTNKCKKLLSSVKNLKCIESVDSFKLAEEINKSCKNLEIEKMNIYLQINISNEESKSGLNYEDVIPLYDEITKKLERVEVAGIMSLGDIGNEEQFKKMYDLKRKICETYSLDVQKFVLSLGTSDDYPEAIKNGSNEVRIGGLIFDV
jgi:pyridoxal phosphate enzyme (YggS family)